MTGEQTQFGIHPKLNATHKVGKVNKLLSMLTWPKSEVIHLKMVVATT